MAEKRLIKLHGTIQNPGSIAATLKEVSAKRLTEARTRIVEWLFRDGEHESVLILGYSCSDHFDINPIVGRIGPAGKSVFLVSHSSDPKQKSINPISQLEDPFLFYRDGSIVECDTARFARDAAEEVGLTIPSDQSPIPVRDWRSVVAEWSSTFAEAGNGNFARAAEALLLRDLGRTTAAYEHLQVVLGAMEVKKEADCFLAAGLLIELGDTADALGLFDAAESAFLASIEFAAVCHADDVRARAFRGLGMVYQIREEYAPALQSLTSALELAVACENKALICECYDGLGIVLRYMREYEEAARCHERAMGLAEHNGLIKAYGQACGNLGLACRYLGDHNIAALWHAKAGVVARRIGDRRMEANQYGNIGLVFYEQRELTNAEEMHLKALAIATEELDDLNILNQHTNLARIYFETRRYGEAKIAIDGAVERATALFGIEHPRTRILTGQQTELAMVMSGQWA